MVTKIYIENNLIDLFEDETMELNSSIADTDDITKINSDYTKTFTVPASDNNNRLFKHYYDADIDNTFDARTKKDARIELDGFPFRTGKIRLEKVSVKSGAPSSYTINFWGNLINFKDLIKDDELTSLDLSAYDHDYNSDNVKLGLTDGLFGGDVVYNLLSKKRQYLYDSTVTNNTETDTLVNIAYNGVARGVQWNELNASIRLLPVIEAIETKYGFNFTRQFFGRDVFTNLYMWASKDSTEKPETSLKVDFDSGDTDFVNLATDTFTCTTYLNGIGDGVRFKWRFSLTPSIGFETIPYTVTVFNNGIQIYQTTFTGLITGYSGTLETTASTTHNLTYFISSRETFSFNSSLNQERQTRGIGGWVSAAFYDTEASEQTILSNFNVAANLPTMKIIDFLKGLFNMFKLVAIPDDNGDVYVNTLDDYYKEGTLHDITQYIDYDNHEVSRGTILNTINFKYQEPTTILNKQFELNTGIAYGDELTTLKDDNDVLLDGGSLEVSIPFEIVVFERLTNLETNSISNIQYGLILDDKLEPANPKPLVYYNNPVQLGTDSISFINDVDAAEEITGYINTPAHTFGLDTVNGSVLFGVEFSTWDYAAINRTLFSDYWSNYVSAIFNIKKREFKFNSKNLPISILTKLQLNDLLKIGQGYYRINNFTVDLLTGNATLNLINSFETNFGLFAPSQTELYLNYKPQGSNVYVSNGSVMNITLTNTGFGTSWITAVQNGSSIDITVTENTGGINRDVFIDVDNGGSKFFQIYVNQDNKVVTFDSTINKFDSTILTFDAQ